ncbi:class I SAM-dependent methyltransferase [Aquibacillus sediminis]|uniref:class I SAM-dependent methyltransferase n=1 Tax=Aquibacillus sediminis TaxID=2574734 RepID=UPI001109CEB8|nr:class I SAM-dependent methyltransferase [Aquibacillus sediminis]
MQKTFANYYDKAMAPLEKRYIHRWRKNLLAKTTGTVLEIGFGSTGINFPIYETCDKVIAIEPNPYMLEKAKHRTHQTSVPIDLVESIAEQLPIADDSVDTIAMTLVLCSVMIWSQCCKSANECLNRMGNFWC